MAKNKTGSRGKYVTFILLVAFVVGVVLVIVFVNLFTPKSTKALAQTVNSVTQSGYLSDSYENNDTIDSYLSKILQISSELETEDVVKIANYQNAMTAYRTMGQFFSRQLVFTTYTSTYKSNKSVIESDFSKAKSSIDGMVAYLEKNLDMASPSTDALVWTWNDCETNIDTILTYTTDAMERLMSLYSSCVDSTILNNDFSTMLFKITTTYMDDLTADTTTSKSGIGLSINNIANIYYTTSGEELLISYSYDTTLQTQTQSLIESGRSSQYFSAFLANTLGGSNV